MHGSRRDAIAAEPVASVSAPDVELRSGFHRSIALGWICTSRQYAPLRKIQRTPRVLQTRQRPDHHTAPINDDDSMQIGFAQQNFTVWQILNTRDARLRWTEPLLTKQCVEQLIP